LFSSLPSQHDWHFQNLVEKGELSKPLIIFNRTNTRSEQLSEKLGKDKTKVAQSIEDAVSSSDIIFTCLGDDKAMEETVESMLKGDVKGKLFCDCSTIHPDTTRKINKSITGAGASFVAAPVFGAPVMAESGQLVFVLAGPAAEVEKMKPYTKGVMGRDLIDYSDQDVGKATLMKVIGNTFVINMVETLSEGHTLAEKSGLGSDNLHQFVEKMFPGPHVAYSNRLKTNDYIRDEVRL
jgi:3-hydroxyisobutyrate dehydrogenase-like beta-hydroxyacid dehydrogenase